MNKNKKTILWGLEEYGSIKKADAEFPDLCT